MGGLSVSRALAVSAALLVTLGGGTLIASPSSAGAAHRPASYAEVLAGPSTGTPARPTGRYARSIDVLSRTAVNAAYWHLYAPGLDLDTGFTGSIDGCQAGTTSAESRAATLNAINYVRSLGGLAPVAFDSTLNSRSQLTALMMSANQQLSHSPSSSWRCYTRTGADNAGRSNLALAYPSISSSSVVGMYMSEPGAENTAAGHRRWLMNPFATQMGSGSTTTANALTVIGPSSTSRPNPAWVSWPTAGWFPDTLEPSGRWSLSAGSSATSFASAHVAVYRNGYRIPVSRNAVENGYAQPTIVWQLPASLSGSGSFRVVASGIRRAGSSRTYSRAYWVRLFTPTQ